MGAGAVIGGALGGPLGAFVGGGTDFVQRMLSRRPQSASPAPPPAAQNDLMDPMAIARRQRAARRMSDGIRDTYSTSTRGTEGASGAGLKGPPQPGDDLPIIPTSPDLPGGVKTVDQQNADAEKAANGDSGPPEPGVPKPGVAPGAPGGAKYVPPAGSGTKKKNPGIIQ